MSGMPISWWNVHAARLKLVLGSVTWNTGVNMNASDVSFRWACLDWLLMSILHKDDIDLTMLECFWHDYSETSPSTCCALTCWYDSGKYHKTASYKKWLSRFFSFLVPGEDNCYLRIMSRSNAVIEMTKAYRLQSMALDFHLHELSEIDLLHFLRICIVMIAQIAIFWRMWRDCIQITMPRWLILCAYI